VTRPPHGGHEDTQSIDARRVVAVGAGIVGLVVVTLGIMWFLIGRLERWQDVRRPAAHALSGVAGERVPPAPRLQDAPLADLEALRAREDAELERWGWADREAGRARVPIARAMELLVERERP